MSVPVGVGVICYEAFRDTLRCVRSILIRSQVPVHVYIFDNSEKDGNTRKYAEARPGITYLSAGRNVGCTVSRNMILSAYRKNHRKGRFLAILDQDVEVQTSWLTAMLAVMAQHERCGIAAWKMGVRGHRKITPEKGRVSEVASLCNLHRIAPLIQARKKWGRKQERPWCEKMFMHKFDSLMCQRLNMLGWYTCVVPGRELIRHHYPHAGVRRNPKWSEIFTESKRVYREIQTREHWERLPGWAPQGKERWIEWQPTDAS